MFVSPAQAARSVVPRRSVGSARAALSPVARPAIGAALGGVLPAPPTAYKIAVPKIVYLPYSGGWVPVAVPRGASVVTVECISGGPTGVYAIRRRLPIAPGSKINTFTGMYSYSGCWDYSPAGASVILIDNVEVCRADISGGPMVRSDPFGMTSSPSLAPTKTSAIARAPAGLYIYGGHGDAGLIALTFE